MNLYRFGTDTIIGGTIQFAAPFQMLSGRVISRSADLSNYTYDSYREDMNLFLSKFPIFTAGYIKIVSERYADTIRRNTLLPEVRGKTTMSLAKQIREESFGDMDSALKHYVTLAANLGIALQSTSTTGCAVTGALVGGSLDVLVTDGEDSLFGTLAGAFLGGLAAESQKKNLGEAMYFSAFESVKTIVGLVGTTPARLVDAYVSNIFGGEANFQARDKEIAYGQEVTSTIINTCSTIFSLIETLDNHFIPNFIGGRRLNKTSGSAELLGELYRWHGYIEQLQESCTAGIMEEARVF